MNALRAILTMSALLVGANASAGKDINWQLDADARLLADARERLEAADLGEASGVVQLFLRRHIDVRDDAVSETVEMAYFYPGDESVQNDGSDEIHWDTHDQDLTVLAASVLSSDGQTHAFDRRTAQVLSDDSDNVFTSEQKVILQLPGLDAGSISVLAYRRSVADRDHFLFGGYAMASLPSLYREFSVAWQGQRPAWHADETAFDCEQTERSVSCVSRMTEPGETDERVDYYDVLPKFTVAADKSWDEVIEDLTAEIANATADRAALALLLDDVRDSELPIETLLAFVARKVRYASFSEAEHAYRPHAIGQTMKNRYGDCKDKSVLMLAALDELGVDAYATLVATFSQDPESLAVPSRGHFDHMVVCAQLADGERCFDPTVAHAGAGTTPSGIQGRTRLNLVPGSTPDRVPTDEYVWEFEVESDLVFQANGSQTERLVRRYPGPYGTLYRRALARREANERSEWLAERHEEAVAELEEATFSVTGVDDAREPLTVTSNGRYDGVAAPGEALSYSDGSFWIRNEIIELEILNKHYDVHIKGRRYRSVYRFDLNKLWRLRDIGANVEFDSRFGRFRRQYTKRRGQVHVETVFEVPSQTVAVADFDAFNRFVELASDQTGILFWGEAR
ncbi:MAG: hypothetical protein AAF610_02475 [Pseudomonadota bacterium]